MNRMTQIEEFAKRTLQHEIAHGYSHVHRVRNWAQTIAIKEEFLNRDVVQAAALLHDIGLPFVKDRREHGTKGAEIAKQFLNKHPFFSETEQQEILHAIHHHNTKNTGNSHLLDIIRDSDMLDMFGCIGIMRACTSHYNNEEYDPKNVKGETWNYSNADFDEYYEQHRGIEITIVDQLNFQISCFDNLKTETAKYLAQPLVEYVKKYITYLEQDVTPSQQ